MLYGAGKRLCKLLHCRIVHFNRLSANENVQYVLGVILVLIKSCIRPLSLPISIEHVRPGLREGLSRHGQQEDLRMAEQANV
jgi:hypothetical protein